MKITDEIKTEDCKLDQADAEDLFFKLLSGKTMSEKIQTSRGEFSVKFPRQKDIELIGLITAQRRMGIPARAFDAEAENTIYKCAVLDVVVESGPQWYENAKKKNENFSWREMPDMDFINEVYLMAHSFRQKVQAKFKQTEKTAIGQNEHEGVQTPVDDGVFSGVASANKRT